MNGGLSDAAMDLYRQVGLAVAGEIDVQLSGAEVDGEPGKLYVAQIQVALASAHIQCHIDWHSIAKLQRPVVLGVANVDILRTCLDNGEIAVIAVGAVNHLRRSFAAGVVKGSVEQVRGTAMDVEFAGRHLQIGGDCFHALQLHGLGFVLHCARRGCTRIARHSPRMEHENAEYDQHGNPCGRNTHASCGIFRMAARPVVIPQAADANQNQNDRPVVSEHPPEVHFRRKIEDETKNAQNNEKSCSPKKAAKTILKFHSIHLSLCTGSYEVERENVPGRLIPLDAARYTVLRVGLDGCQSFVAGCNL